jgi:hypothetical protein
VQSTAVALLVYPFRGQGSVLLLVAAISLYLTLALLHWSADYEAVHTLFVVCIPLVWVLGLGIFQHYAWASLRHVAAGHIETLRTIDVEEVSPLTNYLAFQVALLLLCIAGALAACYALNSFLTIILALATGAVLPAVLGIMILEERFLAGLNPAAVGRFMRDFGAPYSAFASALCIGIASLYVLFLLPYAPDIFFVAGAVYVFVLGHVFAARVIYECRDRLDFATLPDVDPVAAANEAAIESLMLELHRLCGVDRVKDANKRLEGFLGEQNYALDEQVHLRLLEFQYKRLLLEHSWHYMNRLISAGKLPRAWSLMRGSLDVDRAFRPGTAAALLALIGSAPSADADYVDTLLTDFERAYPGDERLPDALFEHARCLFTQFGRADAALELLARIETDFAHWRDDAQFRALQRRVRRQVEAR